MDVQKTVKDPVCGMEKETNEMPETSVYEGKTYYFCSKIDKDMFEANPEHWIPVKEG